MEKLVLSVPKIFALLGPFHGLKDQENALKFQIMRQRLVKLC